MWSVRAVLLLSLSIAHAKIKYVKKGLEDTSDCCPGAVLLIVSGAAADKWPKYYGRWKPKGYDLKGDQYYKNDFGNYLYKLENGKWSANSKVNERGVLRGGADGDGDQESQCLEDITHWKYWHEEEWQPAEITIVCDGQENFRKYWAADIFSAV